MAADVVIVVPVLRRAHRIRPLIASLEAATPEPHRTVFIATSTDRPVIAEILAVAETVPGISLEVLAPNRLGDYARKVNHVYRTSSEPFLFTAADDLDFRPGWLPAALAPFTDPAIGVVGTQDRCNKRTIAGTHSTHLMFRRSYVDAQGTIDAPGLVFHEGYPHEFVDDEAVETAKFRGAWYFAGASVVEHLHPMNGRAPRDELYNAQGERMRLGRHTFLLRRPLWKVPAARPTAATTAIVVATFGETRWSTLAKLRAIPSAAAENPAELFPVHGETLHQARNAGAELATAEWLLFLDADDELEPGYLAAMSSTSFGDLCAPAVRYVNGDAPDYVDGAAPVELADPVSFAERDMRTLNPCPIGTMIRREMFADVEGFWREPAWEDWSLFRRCWLIGAKIEHVPDAVYRAHVTEGGRNAGAAGNRALARQITQSHALWMRRRRARV